MVTKKLIILTVNYLIILLIKPWIKEINGFYARNTSFGLTIYEVGIKCQFFLVIAFYLLGMKPFMIENKLPVQIYFIAAFTILCTVTRSNNDVLGRIKKDIEEMEKKEKENEPINELAREVLMLSKTDGFQQLVEMFLTVTMGHALFLLLSTWLYE